MPISSFPLQPILSPQPSNGSVLNYYSNALFPHLSSNDQYVNVIFYEAFPLFRYDAYISHVQFTYNDRGYVFTPFFTIENQLISILSKYLLLFHGLVAILH